MPFGNLKVTEDPYYETWKFSWSGALSHIVTSQFLHYAKHPQDALAMIAREMAKAIEKDIFEQLLDASVPSSLATSLLQAAKKGSWNDPDVDVKAEIEKHAKIVHASKVNPASNIFFAPPPSSSNGVLASLTKAIPGLKTAVAKQCPAGCDIKDAKVYDMIIHLNDWHKWPREKIADWLETLDVDLSFQAPEPPNPCQKCQYQAEGKWDGANAIAHNDDCPKKKSAEMKGKQILMQVEDEVADWVESLDNTKLQLLTYMTTPVLNPGDAIKIVNPS